MKYVIEHMEPEISEWVRLEYDAIAKEVPELILTSIRPGLQLPSEIADRVTATELDICQLQQIDPQFDVSEVILLDPSAPQELSPDDAKHFKYFLFGGILGDHPPRDRTGDLRKLGFAGRNLGKVQMTTDTAVRVTQQVLKGTPLSDIPYTDFPELRFNEHESTEMPFRYIRDYNGDPIMPAGMRELIQRDSEKTLDDVL